MCDKGSNRNRLLLDLRRVLGILGLLAFFVARSEPIQAADKAAKAPPPLTREHRVASSTATFRTPDDWVISVQGNNPEIVNAVGTNVAVRFLRWDSELGLDALHVMCMVERLAEPMAMEPVVRYEYEFVGGDHADRHVLDSAFVVHYPAPVQGYTEWRERVVTLVGKGEGLCVVAFCPIPLWKKPSAARETMKAVVASVGLP